MWFSLGGCKCIALDANVQKDACLFIRSVHSFIILYVFTGAVKRNPKTSASTLKEVYTAIASWLHGTRDRDGRRLKRVSESRRAVAAAVVDDQPQPQVVQEEQEGGEVLDYAVL